MNIKKKRNEKIKQVGQVGNVDVIWETKEL